MPYILRLAKRGEYTEEALGAKAILYQSVFDVAHPLQLAPAISLATALVHHKTAEATVNGQHVGIPMVRAVLLCFEQSWHVDDVRAFCEALGHSDIRTTSEFYLDVDLAARKAGMQRLPIDDLLKLPTAKSNKGWAKGKKRSR